MNLDELEALYLADKQLLQEDEVSDTYIENTVAHSFSFPKFKIPSFPFPSIVPFFKRINPFGILSEIKIFIILFLIVFSAFFFFTNAKLVFVTFNDIITSQEENQQVSLENIEEHNVAPALTNEKKEKLLALEESFESLKKQQREEQEMALTMQEFLDKKQETHGLNFNTLPPNNRLIIPSLNVNVPLIDIPVIGQVEFEDGDFDDELMQGVVKYPTTATPGNQGNSLIFGHSSTEWWHHNEYGFVFRNLPKLQVGDKIQVIWNGQLTTYEMVERKVVSPKEVEKYYQEFQEKNGYYLTLMGCYPVGSDAKRMMVVFKKIANE